MGLVGGFVSGMFGVGGAVITKPGLRTVIGTSPSVALGTPLPATVPATVAGALTYHKRGLVDTRITVLCGLGGVAGSICGALTTELVEHQYLMLAFGGILLYVAVVTFRRGITGRIPAPLLLEEESVDTGEADRGPTYERSTLLLLAIGVVGGFVSGLLGIGGGSVFVPAFMYVLKAPIKKAVGTSLSVIAIVAVPGSIVHAFLGNVSGLYLVMLLLGQVPGAVLGARLTIRAKERLLYILLGVFLAAITVVFVLKEVMSL